nr:hemagglutinin [Actinomyces sp.]
MVALRLLVVTALAATGYLRHAPGWDDDVVSVVTLPVLGPAPVALDTSGFDAAHIIDDDVFYDSETMRLDEVTAFVEKVNDGCQTGMDGTPCLAVASFDTEDREPAAACPGGYSGAPGQSAAQIVSEVATACDVNPQVLLVLLQKEQGLLTASGAGLSARRYEAATGYACPDGAQCDPQWAGFFRQVYGAASQFQRYRLSPGSYQVVAGVPTTVAYSPLEGCSGAELVVANQATAGLYDYTPYQPNEAVSSGGDDCTSWGNWNFYGYFHTFFGDPTPSTP